MCDHIKIVLIVIQATFPIQLDVSVTSGKIQIKASNRNNIHSNMTPRIFSHEKECYVAFFFKNVDYEMYQQIGNNDLINILFKTINTVE